MTMNTFSELQTFKTLSGIGARMSNFEGGELAIIASDAVILKAAWEKLTAGKLTIEVSKCQRAVVMSAGMPIFSANAQAPDSGNDSPTT